MAELTERQQEIKGLLDQDKTPGEIASSLGITENAVYQHLRRMREKTGGSTRRRGSTRRQTPRAATPAPSAPASEPRTMTPLQAIRARKALIEHELTAARNDVSTAERALRNAQEALAKRDAQHSAELGNLNNAEAALTGKPAPARAKVTRAKNARKRNTGAKAKSTQANGSTPETTPAETTTAGA